MNILVLCEHFAPINKTASFRTMALARYLPAHNITPFIVTASQADDVSKDNFAYDCPVIRVDCGITWLAEWRHKYAGSLFGKFCGLFDELLDNYSFYNPLRHLMPAAETILTQHKIDAIIVSAPNFSLIKTAQKLAQKYQLRWIIDFRDDWVTNEEVTGFTRFKYRLEHHIFRSYTAGANALIAVSEHQRQKLQLASGIQTVLFENGYDHYQTAELQDDKNKSSPIVLSENMVNLIYTGTIYQSQNLSYLSQILDRLDISLRQKIALYFVGSQSSDLQAFADKYNNIHIIPSRLSKTQTDQLLAQADSALYIAYQHQDGNPIKGVPSSKLYEYIKLQKPVFMAPSDNDIAQQIVSQIGLCLSSGTIEQDALMLEKLISEKQKNGKITRIIDQQSYETLSRSVITARLAEWLLTEFSPAITRTHSHNGTP